MATTAHLDEQGDMPARAPSAASGAREAGISRHAAARAGLASEALIGGRVSLRTLIIVRWVAVGGQLATVLVVRFILGFEMPLALVLSIIAASAGVNIAAMLHRQARPRISDAQAGGYIAFDIGQLGALLYCTGGLINPFAVLMIAPLAMAATVLSRPATILLAAGSLGLLTVLALWHMPLPWDGPPPDIPGLHRAGAWVALAVTMVFVAAYCWRLAEEGRRMSDALAASQVALAREQRVSALGGLAAAAAHELGSPLGTIAVVAKELSNELDAESPLREDVDLLREETDRCQRILTQLARQPEDQASTGAEGAMPASSVVEQAARNHVNERSTITFQLAGQGEDQSEPHIPASPEVLHGLGNLIQNAVQFAAASVTVRITWCARAVQIDIIDDGPGFPPALLARLDEPDLHRGAWSRFGARESQEPHLGLGIFIAQTLLARTGAAVRFRNRAGDSSDGGGAQVTVRWPRGA